MKISVLSGGLILGYLEQFAPALLLLGVIFIGAYIAPVVLTGLDKLKEPKNKEALH